jgi:hypothetical protein
VAWDSSNQYKSAPGSFLFTLLNPRNSAPTIFPANTSGNDIHCGSNQGPTFGSGHDMIITNNCNTYNCSFNFPHAYSDTQGHGSNTFTGLKTFLVSDIEVFQVK